MLIVILVSAAVGACLGFGSAPLIRRARRPREMPALGVPEDAELQLRIGRLKLPRVYDGHRGTRADSGSYALSYEHHRRQGEFARCEYCQKFFRWLRQHEIIPAPEGCRDLGLTRPADRALFCEGCGHIEERIGWDSDAKDMFEFVAELERMSAKPRRRRFKELSDHVSDCEASLVAARAELETLTGGPTMLAGPPYRPMLVAKDD